MEHIINSENTLINLVSKINKHKHLNQIKAIYKNENDFTPTKLYEFLIDAAGFEIKLNNSENQSIKEIMPIITHLTTEYKSIEKQIEEANNEMNKLDLPNANITPGRIIKLNEGYQVQYPKACLYQKAQNTGNLVAIAKELVDNNSDKVGKEDLNTILNGNLTKILVSIYPSKRIAKEVISGNMAVYGRQVKSLYEKEGKLPAYEHLINFSMNLFPFK